MVYEGNEKYIFVSYAHNDADRVLPIVDALMNDGYRVWFDSGIEAGTEWPEYIEDHLMNSHVVLVFMSPSAVESRNCRNEINFALELKKEMLVIYLEDTTLLKGMRLQLNSTQSFFRKHHNSEETFIRELLNARILQGCRGTDGDHVMPELKPQKAAAVASGEKRSKLPMYAMLGAILAALVILICVLTLGGNDKPSKGSEGEKPAVTEPLTMSDNLFDYTVDIEGVIYKFPCKYEDFASQGWTIISSGYSEDALLSGGRYDTFEMARNGKTIQVEAYNLSGNATAIKDCLVSGIEFGGNSNLDIKLAKDITIHSTADEIMAAYGSPNTHLDLDDCVSLTYEQQTPLMHSYVKFNVYKDPEEAKYSFITLSNMVQTQTVATETNTERPEYLDDYRAPAELGTDFKTGMIMIGGDLYQLPAPVSCFLDNGWSFKEQPSYVASGNEAEICLKREDAQMYLHVMNFAQYQTTPENCVVNSVRVEDQDGVDIQLPNGFQFGLTSDEVRALATEEFDLYEGSYSTNWCYSEYSGREIYLSIDVSAETQKVEQIELSCETWDY